MPLVRLLLLLLFLAPFLELALLLRIAGRLGLPWTLVWIGGTAVIGWSLCRGLQARVLERLRQAAVANRIGGAQGVLIFEEVTAAALRGLAGILLILPGAITDCLGLVLLVPPLDLLALWGLRVMLARSVTMVGRGGPAGPTGATDPSDPGREPSGGQRRAAGDGTPGGAGGEGPWVVRDVDFEIVGADEPGDTDDDPDGESPPAGARRD